MEKSSQPELNKKRTPSQGETQKQPALTTKILEAIPMMLQKNIHMTWDLSSSSFDPIDCNSSKTKHSIKLGNKIEALERARDNQVANNHGHTWRRKKIWSPYKKSYQTEDARSRDHGVLPFCVTPEGNLKNKNKVKAFESV